MASDTKLCSQCSSIPLDRLSRSQLRAKDTHYILTFLFSAECEFCEMLREIALDYNWDGPELSISNEISRKNPSYLLRITNEKIYPRQVAWISLKAPKPMSSSSTLPLADRTQSPVNVRSINVQNVDWDLINSWIRHCYKDPRHLYCRSTDLALRNVLVIDCNSRCVIPLPQGCRYAALSYVWGSSTSLTSDSFERTLPSPAPQVIEDAIRCAKKLRLHYLWVDRYCIDQKSDSKHMLIQNMDQIYGCASVTIINAAGASSDCGLPGVSTVSRQPQRSITIGGRRLFRIPSSRAEILNSKWASRGWTLQEGLLSNQRLVFTPSQVYFQCKIWHCCEIVPGAFNSVRIEDRLRKSSFAQNLQAFEYHERFNPVDWEYLFTEILRQYLKRQLTFESDILLAFVAVIKSLSVHHCWGMPFRLTGENTDPAAALMTWLLCLPQSPPETSHLIKRKGLPSWSWAAWKGISWLARPIYSLVYCGYTSLEVKVAIEEVSGERFSVAEYCSIMEVVGDPYQFCPFLHIDGWVTMVQLSERKGASWPWDYGSNFDVEVYEHTGNVHLAFAVVTRVVLPEEPEWKSSELLAGTWPLLVLFDGQHKQGSSAVNVSGLVLRPCKDGSYQKLGVLRSVEMVLERGSDAERAGDHDGIKLRGKQGSGGFECEWRSIKLA